jgi:hypothetical protein
MHDGGARGKVRIRRRNGCGDGFDGGGRFQDGRSGAGLAAGLDSVDAFGELHQMTTLR